jgi:hypothetical protein
MALLQELHSSGGNYERRFEAEYEKVRKDRKWPARHLRLNKVSPAKPLSTFVLQKKIVTSARLRLRREGPWTLRLDPQ